MYFLIVYILLPSRKNKSRFPAQLTSTGKNTEDQSGLIVVKFPVLFCFTGVLVDLNGAEQIPFRWKSNHHIKPIELLRRSPGLLSILS